MSIATSSPKSFLLEPEILSFNDSEVDADLESDAGQPIAIDGT